MKIEELNENNFQKFLEQNKKDIFVYETSDYEYPQYFAVHKKLTTSAKNIHGRFARQCG